MRFKGLANSSGGPSSASSGDCSSPILLFKKRRKWKSEGLVVQLLQSDGIPSITLSGEREQFGIYLKSQTFSLRSVPLEARIVSLWGDH